MTSLALTIATSCAAAGEANANTAISALPRPARVERSRDTPKARTTDRHLDFGQRPKFILSARPAGSRRARCERNWERLKRFLISHLPRPRSEEHPSELQSPTPCYYAVSW